MWVVVVVMALYVNWCKYSSHLLLISSSSSSCSCIKMHVMATTAGEGSSNWGSISSSTNTNTLCHILPPPHSHSSTPPSLDQVSMSMPRIRMATSLCMQQPEVPVLILLRCWWRRGRMWRGGTIIVRHLMMSPLTILFDSTSCPCSSG